MCTALVSPHSVARYLFYNASVGLPTLVRLHGDNASCEHALSEVGIAPTLHVALVFNAELIRFLLHYAGFCGLSGPIGLLALIFNQDVSVCCWIICC